MTPFNMKFFLSLRILGLDHYRFLCSRQAAASVASWNSPFDLIHLFTRALLNSHCLVPLEWKPFLQLIWSSASLLLWDLIFVLNHTAFYFSYLLDQHTSYTFLITSFSKLETMHNHVTLSHSQYLCLSIISHFIIA